MTKKKITIENNTYPSKQELNYYVNQGLTHRQMQTIFGLSSNSLYNALEYYGLKKESKMDGDIRRIIELRKEGDSISEIAKEMNISEQTVYTKLKSKKSISKI